MQALSATKSGLLPFRNCLDEGYIFWSLEFWGFRQNFSNLCSLWVCLFYVGPSPLGACRKGPWGRNWTSIAEPYPPGLCRLFATLAENHFDATKYCLLYLVPSTPVR